MKFERNLPASFSAAGKLQIDHERFLVSVGFDSPEVKWKVGDTWGHEETHRATFNGPGHYDLVVIVSRDSLGRLNASWTASFTPLITEDIDPMLMVRTAMAPGARQMSEQDKRVAKIWRNIYYRKLEEERLISIQGDPIGENVIQDKEGIIKERTRRNMINDYFKIFSGKINDLVEQGRFPTPYELTKEPAISKVLNEYKDEILWVAREACNDYFMKEGVVDDGAGWVEDSELESDIKWIDGTRMDLGGMEPILEITERDGEDKDDDENEQVGFDSHVVFSASDNTNNSEV